MTAKGIPSVPTFYADQAAELAMGSLACKLTFGYVNSQNSGTPDPVVTVVMPSAAMLELAKEIIAQFEHPGYRQFAVKGLQAAAKTIATVGRDLKPTGVVSEVEMKEEPQKPTVKGRRKAG